MEDSGLNGGKNSQKSITFSLHMHKIVVCKCPQLSELCFTSEGSITHRCLVIFFCILFMVHEHTANVSCFVDRAS
jgi:hypothetical protein